MFWGLKLQLPGYSFLSLIFFHLVFFFFNAGQTLLLLSCVMSETCPTCVSRHISCVFLRICYVSACRVHFNVAVPVQHNSLLFFILLYLLQFCAAIWSYNNNNKVFTPNFCGQPMNLFHSVPLGAILLNYMNNYLMFLNCLHPSSFRPSSPHYSINNDPITFPNYSIYWPVLHLLRPSQSVLHHFILNMSNI